MDICHPHNLAHPRAACERRFGIRLTLPPGDTFTRILGADWAALHWYPSAAARDAALAELTARHRFSRSGDRPTYRYEKLARDERGNVLAADAGS